MAETPDPNDPGGEAGLGLVAAGRHRDPHSLLGPHLEEGRLVVRVRAPDARSVRVLVDGGLWVVAPPRTDLPGLFEAVVPPGLAAPPDRPPHEPLLAYEVEITDAAGAVRRAADPYAFAPILGELDLHLFGEGRHHHVHRHLGAHPREIGGVAGVAFSVWAPHARRVAVTGAWSAWRADLGAMRRTGAGVWELFVPGAAEGDLYKFEIEGETGVVVEKADPFARAAELRPGTASRVFRSRHAWGDQAWMAARAGADASRGRLSIYEVHLPSWRRKNREVAPGEPPLPPEASRRWLTYRELADELIDYVVDLGFTHIELLPVLEHPYDGSWGYQVTGFFAPTSRLGDPDEFRWFVDRAHQKGLGVILDWVPAHFPKDAAGLGRFDGTPLFEHWDPRRGEHKQWGTFIFDLGRPQVKNFLLASALSWLEDFHVDGLRVDAVASMLYLDYASEGPHDWSPNQHGGRENLEAVAFLRELNDVVHARCPGAIVCAEESTSWPGVTRPTYTGGLGFDLKWNMGWMHDSLAYSSMDSIFRSFHHAKITFGLWYAWGERYLLPLSHDEVVHLKKSLWSKMPGDVWKKAANLRALLATMWAHPGKKLLFMGGEFGQTTEWSFATELEWSVLADPLHRGVQDLVRDLNGLHVRLPALWELDDRTEGFSWIDANDAPQSVFSWVRWRKGDGPSAVAGRGKGEHVVMVANFTPLPRSRYRIGLPRPCAYRELLNTDARAYGGSGVGNMGRVLHLPEPSHGHAQSALVEVPPLGVVYLVPEDLEDPEPPPTSAGDPPPAA
jgi:1,4-alpha-glucan branching enzyme